MPFCTESKIEALDMSLNHLRSEGVKRLLEGLNGCTIRTLKLGVTIHDYKETAGCDICHGLSSLVIQVRHDH